MITNNHMRRFHWIPIIASILVILCCASAATVPNAYAGQKSLTTREQASIALHQQAGIGTDIHNRDEANLDGTNLDEVNLDEIDPSTLDLSDVNATQTGYWGGVYWFYVRNTQKQTYSLYIALDHETVVDKNPGIFLEGNDKERIIKQEMTQAVFCNNIYISEPNQLEHMFDGAVRLHSVSNLGKLHFDYLAPDVQYVSFAYMFARTNLTRANFKPVDLSRFDTCRDPMYMGACGINAEGMYAGSTIETLKDFRLPYHLIYNMDSMFANMRRLKHAILNNCESTPLFSVTASARSMFKADIVLEDVVWQQRMPNLKYIDSAFEYCNLLKQVNLDAMQSLKIQNAQRLFVGCNHLEEVSLQNYPEKSEGIVDAFAMYNTSPVRKLTVSKRTLSLAYGLRNKTYKYETLPYVRNTSVMWEAKGKQQNWAAWATDRSLFDRENVTFTRVGK
ncbi:hypothetical protein D2E26_0187 [Bifidobacterium dolichotidis]|uniref:Leucine-rich repeat domain-containing protein n=1 Tax=Bifidobacterium dolichotidis TaxID=2306976 RepID=A0A430FRX6_9BIFI|nr:hypothetical protein [Bifidobacterium dolichotidis]RSX55624.1 hypothetical protein D2E26_0187 [Bifidobacterium dolichotidis]